MKVLGIRNIRSEAGCLYYFRKYTGIAMVQLPGSTLNAPVSFSIETNPLGMQSIEVNLKGTIEYPILPILKALKEYIKTEDSAGSLPI